MRRNVTSFQCQVWWLRAAGLPAAHVAFVIGNTEALVNQVPAQDHPFTTNDLQKYISDGSGLNGVTGVRIRRLKTLGYPARQIAKIVRRDPRRVAAFLACMTAADGSILKKSRTRQEQREFTENRKRFEAKAAAKAARWHRCRDIDPPPVALVADQAAAELVTEAPPVKAPAPLPEPTRWHQTADPRTRFGEGNGRSKLTWSDVQECRRLHAEGFSFYRLGRRFGVAANTVAYAVKGDTWRMPDAPELPELAPPPAAKPEKNRKPRDKRHRWRVTGDRRRTTSD